MTLRYNIRTMTKFISGLMLTAVLAVAFPQTTQAYLTSSQTSVQLTDTTAMYTITYSFSGGKYDFYLPVVTARNLLHSESESTLGYTIRENDDTTSIGDTAALVFSTAKLVDGMYFIPKGERKTFTLVTFFRTDIGTHQDDYALQVENLPFLVDIGGDALQLRGLNPSELTYYATEEVRLNE